MNILQSCVVYFNNLDIVTNNVKVIKVDYTRFENSCYLQIFEYRVSSEYQARIV